LDKAGAHPNSSLFRLYQAGVRELAKRKTGEVGAQPLSGASIDAVKAAIDADLVRENHALNSRMVLLTIAISGGPFLGLLGTVVGVMITFAAIAAAGDVNVNAIAPGIAAALLATVAGLAVAIPALFGYNYLASRIKNISSDMQIFVDEFVTRVAENYGAR
jgi:biopolymer transport protein ExbB